MHLTEIYWILMLFWVLGSFYIGWKTPVEERYGIAGWSIVVFLLFVTLGWAVFGPAVK